MRSQTCRARRTAEVFAVLLAACSVAACHEAPTERISVSFGRWSVDVPRGWEVQRFSHVCKIGAYGVLAHNAPPTTFRHASVPGGGCTTAWSFRDAPPGFVAVEIFGIAGGLEPVDAQRAGTPLPLRFRDLAASRSSRFQRRSRAFTERGRLFLVQVLFDSDAPKRDRKTAAAIVESVRFPP